MKGSLFNDIVMLQERNIVRTGLLVLVLLFVLGCKGSDTTTTPGPGIFDPLNPTVDSFKAKRGTVEITDGIVYSGEDINLVVEATSQAWPVSCGLPEDATVSGNLAYFFNSEPPTGVDAPGLITMSSPPDNLADWRVPNLDQYDTGEGVVYALKVTVLDECLDRENSGTVKLRAFANQGPPIVDSYKVESGIGSGSPVIEELDQNGFYEVERADKCRITLDAQSRTMTQICSNHGIPSGSELSYLWESSIPVINLAHNQDPVLADNVNFDIPVTIDVSDEFEISCTVKDECSGEITQLAYRFIVIGKPVITSLSGTADGINLAYDQYFDTNPVLNGDEIILTATGLLLDSGLCIEKGIEPSLEWKWEETTSSIPALDPDYDPYPLVPEMSTVEFVIPAATNGTEYKYKVTLTDLCNGLEVTDTINLLVLVPPEVEVTSFSVNGDGIQPVPATGRYEIHPSDIVSIRVTANAESSDGFCEARGVSDSTPLFYSWFNPFSELVLFNYETNPEASYSDLVFVVPDDSPEIDVNLTGIITDLCNELHKQVSIPISVVHP